MGDGAFRNGATSRQDTLLATGAGVEGGEVR